MSKDAKQEVTSQACTETTPSNVGSNIDAKVVEGFGEEWAAFDQSARSEAELRTLFDEYFSIFPWEDLPDNAEGFDMGCGSGRFARFAAERAGTLHLVDASAKALDVARANTAHVDNCEYHNASVGDKALQAQSMDFGYSLGVLHHIPDTQAGIQACVDMLKPGAPFLVYLYYAFDNRPWWFKLVWKASDLARRVICRLPFKLRLFVTQVIAVLVYYPLARLAKLLEKLGLKVDNLPLAAYRHKPFYDMRTDSLDRFGTRLEQRFTRAQITDMMENAGLADIRFREDAPFWCAVGRKK
ncbi:MAG: class I SAM-dependent methyltransferase [Desulfovibrio sp.]|nr:MAG: class I SAM-dependent methyltransferase [Desulfovibrio sp.]